MRPARAVAAALAAGFALACPPCGAASLQVCDAPAVMTAGQNDVLLRFAAVVKARLDDSGHAVALIARSGTDLHRLGVRYSHAGVAMKGNAGLPWSVRELYYACDEKRPRLYDEGMAGFLLGTDDPHTSWVSLVLLPPQASSDLERAALDKRRALAVLGATYSANAYPFSTLYQNCNQWVAELLAGAWGGADAAAGTPADARAAAQRWLAGQGYAPAVFETSLPPLMWIVHVVPWLHGDDHPREELAQDRFSVSMPSSIEVFVRARVPGATRMELCHSGPRVVVHRGWDAIADGCVAGPGDETFELEKD